MVDGRATVRQRDGPNAARPGDGVPGARRLRRGQELPVRVDLLDRFDLLDVDLRADLVGTAESADAGIGASDLEFSSIKWVSSSWSMEPQLTPMRTGLSNLMACSMIDAIWLSRFFLKPTLPGLIRYFARASAQAG